MRSLFAIASVVATVLAEQRDFAPQVPQGIKHNAKRIWLHLSPKCFPKETSVREFKDHLVKAYDCVSFDELRHQRIWKHVVSANESVWSIFLDRASNAIDFSCLTNTIELPNNHASSCVENVLYEPMQYTTSYACDVQGSKALQGTDLWSLDYLDGYDDGVYRYPLFTDAVSASVEAIILDTGVDETHVEFAGLTATDLNELYNSPIRDSTSYEHGTHVAGTVVGHDTGGAKETNFAYFAVCQDNNGCSWSDISNGYNYAIEYMLKDQSKRYVINYSVGGGRSTFTDDQYIAWGKSINNAGGIWVTSAGNSGTDTCNGSPAFSTENIAVGAYDVNKQAAYFSNYGSTCTQVWGPGVAVWSAAPGGGYQAFSGTSMASPNVASVVVNLLKENSDWDLADLNTYMKNKEYYFEIDNGGNAVFLNTCSA